MTTSRLAEITAAAATTASPLATALKLATEADAAAALAEVKEEKANAALAAAKAVYEKLCAEGAPFWQRAIPADNVRCLDTEAHWARVRARDLREKATKLADAYAEVLNPPQLLLLLRQPRDGEEGSPRWAVRRVLFHPQTPARPGRSVVQHGYGHERRPRRRLDPSTREGRHQEHRLGSPFGSVVTVMTTPTKPTTEATRIRPDRTGPVRALAGPRLLVAAAVAKDFEDEALSDALLRTATEEVVGAIALKSLRTFNLRKLTELGVTALYAHPTQGLQRATMHTLGRWQPVAAHADVWRLDLSSLLAT